MAKTRTEIEITAEVQGMKIGQKVSVDSYTAKVMIENGNAKSTVSSKKAASKTSEKKGTATKKTTRKKAEK